MNYDDYKLATPEESDSREFADVEIEVGVWVTPDEYEEITVTLQVPVEEDWDDGTGKIIVPVQLEESISNYMSEKYPECEYDLLYWEFI